MNFIEFRKSFIEVGCVNTHQIVALYPVKNKQGRVYGIRFGYKGEIFKASEIGREFGLHSLYNHYGLKLKGQTGTPFVPQYAQRPGAATPSTPNSF